MITKESPLREAGRPIKYDFYDLKPGECKKFHNMSTTQYRAIMTALWRHRVLGASGWETTTRFDNNTVSVYRLK